MSDVRNLCKFKSGKLISGGKKFSELLALPPLILYLNFKNFRDLISLSFVRLQCILVDLGVLFSGFGTFYKLKRADLISGGENPFCRYSELLCPLPLLYLNFKNSKDPCSLTFIRF